jgi:hypothetical protein
MLDMLSTRHKRFIAAALRVGNGKDFDWNTVAAKLWIESDEARDTAITLSKFGVLTGIGYQSTSAIFTAAGRDLARDAVDEGFSDGLTP